MQRVWLRARTQFHYLVQATHIQHTTHSHFRTGPLATQRLLPLVRNHAVGSQLLAWQCNGCFSCSGITPWAPSPSERWGPSSGRSGWGPGAGRSGGAGPGAGGAVGAWAPAAADGARFDNTTYNSASGIEEQRVEDSKAVGFGSGYRARQGHSDAAGVPTHSCGYDCCRCQTVGRLCNFGAAFHRTPAYHLIRTVQFVTVRRSAEKQKTNSNSSSMITTIIFPVDVFDAVASPSAHPLARSKNDFPIQASTGNS